MDRVGRKNSFQPGGKKRTQGGETLRPVGIACLEDDIDIVRVLFYGDKTASHVSVSKLFFHNNP